MDAHGPGEEPGAGRASLIRVDFHEGELGVIGKVHLVEPDPGRSCCVAARGLCPVCPPLTAVGNPVELLHIDVDFVSGTRQDLGFEVRTR